MKISHQTKALRAELARLASMPGVVRTAPETQMVTITASVEGVEISRATLSAKLTLSSAASVEDEGEATVTFQRFSQVLSSLTAEEVGLEIRKTDLFITCGKASVKLPALQLEGQKNTIALSGEAEALNVPLEDFLERLGACLPHASQLETDGGLFGISLRINDETEFCFCGTDRKKLAFAWMPGASAKLDAVLHPESAKALLAAFPDGSGALEISGDRNLIAFRAMGMECLFALMCDGFPNYPAQIAQVVGRAAVGSFKINRADFIAALAKAAPFGVHLTIPALTIAPQKDEVEIIATSPDVGEYRLTVGATSKKSEPFTINSQTLRDTLASLRGAAVEVKNIGQGIYMEEEDRKIFASSIIKA